MKAITCNQLPGRIEESIEYPVIVVYNAIFSCFDNAFWYADACLKQRHFSFS